MSERMIGVNVNRNHTTLLSAKWVALVFLLVAEVLALTIRFDSKTLSASGLWLNSLTDHVSAIPQMVAVILTATLIFGGREMSESLIKISEGAACDRNWKKWLVLHICLFIIFVMTTRYFFEVDRGATSAWFALWLLLGASSFGAWLATTIQPSRWSPVGKALIGPVLVGSIMGIAAWIAGKCAINYWEPLAYWTFQSVGFLLYASGIEVSQDIVQLVIGTSLFSVRIAPECSGYEGMGLAVIFMSTYLWWRRSDHTFPNSFLLIPISIALMFLANAVRIAVLILIGHWGWQEIALGGFHSQAGWMAFNLVALGLVAYARVSPFFSRRGLSEREITTYESIPMLMPFVLLTLTIMISGIIQNGFDWLYPLRILTVCLAIAFLAKQYRADVWKWTWDWAGPSIGIAVFLIWIILEPWSGIESNKTLVEGIRTQSPMLLAVWFLFRIVGSVITVPIAEEFAFRGYLLPWLSSSRQQDEPMRWSWGALLISSAAFGILHPGRWIAGTVAGCLYGMAYYKRRVLMDAVLAHATTNGLIAVYVITTSHWNLWS